MSPKDAIPNLALQRAAARENAPDVSPEVHFTGARNSLIGTMEVYGIDPKQAEMQVDNLVSAVLRVTEEGAAWPTP